MADLEALPIRMLALPGGRCQRNVRRVSTHLARTCRLGGPRAGPTRRPPRRARQQPAARRI